MPAAPVSFQTAPLFKTTSPVKVFAAVFDKVIVPETVVVPATEKVQVLVAPVFKVPPVSTTKFAAVAAAPKVTVSPFLMVTVASALEGAVVAVTQVVPLSIDCCHVAAVPQVPVAAERNCFGNAFKLIPVIDAKAVPPAVPVMATDETSVTVVAVILREATAFRTPSVVV